MIILATHKRPKNIMRFFRICKQTQVTEKVLLLIDEDDNSYEEILTSLPKNFSVLRIPPGCCASRRANIPFEKFPNEPYYAIMGDDVFPVGWKWDQVMREAAGEWNIAYCDDGIQGKHLATHPFIGGELVRAQGFVEEPSMLDWFADNCRMDVGAELGLLRYVENVKFDHLHHINGKADFDQTYAKQKNGEGAYAEYLKWRLFGGFSRTVRKIEKAIKDAKPKM